MIDTFRAVVIVPDRSSLFRNANIVILTPTGSVETWEIQPKVWRDLDNEVSVRDYVESRLITMYPGRVDSWHGSRVDTYYEGVGQFAVIEVDCDHKEFADPTNSAATI
jgi:hypothetical protein